MEEFFANFHFLRPWILLLLVAPLALYGGYFKGVTAQSSWQKVIDKRLLDYLLVKGSALKRKVFIWVGLIGLFAAVIAAAGPSGQKTEVPLMAVQNPVMIILNLSTDMSDKDIKPSRLERAKYKIKDVLALLKGGQVGLEVYSSEPFVIAPLTEDVRILDNLLPAVNTDIMPANGDRLDRAIELAVERIKEAGFDKGNLIVFAADVGQGFNQALESAKKAKAAGFEVNIIGVSAETNEKLAMVAAAGGGEYWKIQDDDASIASWAGRLNQGNNGIKESQNSKVIWLDAGWMLLEVPMLCCLMFFRRGLLGLVLAGLLASPAAQAGFLTNADEDGYKAFNNGNYEAAAQVFKEPNWKAAAYYRAGDYDKALAEYQKDTSVEGLYNQGNALAKGGKIKEAIEKYEEVLKQQPAHEDAAFNLEYLKKQQNQQQNQQTQQNQNESSEDNQDSESPQNNEQNQDEPQAQDKEQAAENESSGENNSEDNKNQNDPEQETGEQDKNSDNEDERAQNERQKTMNELDKDQSSSEGKQQETGALSQEEKEDEYDEKMQAKAQQYRDIPEDPGGLLKAFIYREYRQNRYNEQ